MIIQSGTIKIEPYWNLINTSKIVYKNNDDYVFHFRELFDKAVESRLRSIGSVAVMMSGGLDSTSIYCNSKKKLS